MQYFHSFMIMNLFYDRFINLNWSILELNESYHMTHIAWLKFWQLYQWPFWPYLKLSQKSVGWLLLQTRWSSYCLDLNNFNFGIHLCFAQIRFLLSSQIQKIPTQKEGKFQYSPEGHPFEIPSASWNCHQFSVTNIVLLPTSL